MSFLLLIVFLNNFPSIFTLQYEQPVAATLWHERCKKNSHVLNDCNWCWCDPTYQYRCSARVCGQVDMFGHFNDAIKDINVGMEGKGSWRSTDSACVPGVYYRRGTVLCVCNEDGYWPNPVCRDIFRILHSVEVTRGIEVTQKCEPTKLYLVSCNVCFCPSTGLLNLEFCTKLTCSNEDPVLNATAISKEEPESKEDLEVYATCNTTTLYSLGCQTCTCLRNNRLLCDNCTSVDKTIQTTNESNVSICSKYDIGKIFNVDCNICFCDENLSIYCTTRQCLKRFPIKTINLLSTFESTDAPIGDHNCKPGTKYNKDCNTCYCDIQNGGVAFSCTMKQCDRKTKMDLLEDCVDGTVYERNCLICRCDVVNEKRETCVVDTRCSKLRGDKDVHTHGLELLYGFCLPLHVYTNDCNTCQCVNGKIWKCTTHNCVTPSPITVDLIPVHPIYPDPCPKGGSYKLDCNICFCLDNVVEPATYVGVVKHDLTKDKYEVEPFCVSSDD